MLTLTKDIYLIVRVVQGVPIMLPLVAVALIMICHYYINNVGQTWNDGGMLKVEYIQQ